MANLISAYHFDGDSTDKIDGNDGSDTGVVYDASVKHLGSHSAKFDGDDFISLGDPANLQPDTISLGLWFNMSSVSTLAVMFRKRAFGYATLHTASGHPWATISGNNTQTAQLISADEYDDGSWHRFLVTFDGDVAKLFVDNILKALFAFSSTTTIKYGAGGIAFGQDGNSPTSRYTGYLDAPAIWDGALTDGGVTIIDDPAGGEVAADWNGGVGFQYPVTAGVAIFRRRMEGH